MNILSINWGNALDIVGFGISMVFILLIILVVVLNIFSKIIAPTVRIPVKTSTSPQKSNTEENIEYEEGHLSANDSAAIAMALHLYYAEVHDDESAIITIKTVERRYSPWSSKIYGINNLVK